MQGTRERGKRSCRAVFSSLMFSFLSVLCPSPSLPFTFRITNIVSDALIPRVCSSSDLLFKIFVLMGGWFTIVNVVNFAMHAVA